MNPATATTLFKAPLTLDGKSTQDLAVAIDQALGSGHFTYIGFTLENVQQGGAAALGGLLKQATPPAPAPAAQVSRSVRTQTLTVAGTASRSVRTDTLVVTGTASRTVKTEPLVVTGIRSREVRTEPLTVTGAASRR